MHPKDKDENAKDPAWKTPMDIAGVNPGDYNATTTASGGSPLPDTPRKPGEPYHAGPIDPAGKALKTVSEGARKLAMQDDISG